MPPVITTSALPSDPGGDTAVTVLLSKTVTLVARTPPTDTVVVVAKYSPMMVISVPPVILPSFGVIDEIDVGMYVNVCDALVVPAGVVTTIDAGPIDPVGVIAVTTVDDTGVTLVHGTPPIVIAEVCPSHVPVIEITVPASTHPWFGDTLEIVAGQYPQVERSNPKSAPFT